MLYFAQQIGAGFTGLNTSRIYTIYTISKRRMTMRVNVFLILTILKILKILLRLNTISKRRVTMRVNVFLILLIS